MPIYRRRALSLPSTEFILRSDSGFALPEIYEWCEKEHVNYVISISKNNRLLDKALPYRVSSCLLHQFRCNNAFCNVAAYFFSWASRERVTFSFCSCSPLPPVSRMD
ncbi:MAG: transposase [Candidatus Xenobiia bacterium LiM19]